MFAKKLLIAASVLVPLIGGILYAQSIQPPVINIDPHRHGNLSTAQAYIVAAFQKIDAAETANGDQPGGSTKTVRITQTGTHIEFSTKTRDVLTFRGDVEGDTTSGLYGVHVQHAP